MKAVTRKSYGTSEVLKITENERPVPTGNQVLIKVKATTINDWDLGLLLGDPFIIRLMSGLSTPKVKILGTEMSGLVEETGSEVKTLNVGDQVYGDLSEDGFGTFAEYVCAKETSVRLKPDSLSFAEAAALPHASLLAWQGLTMGKLADGMDILINGAGGGVGTLGIQMANMYDTRVTGVDSGEKLTRLKELGFDYCIDYRQEDFTRNKNSYDLILDVKTTRPVSHYVRTLKPGGRYVTVGGAFSRIIRTFASSPFVSMIHNKHVGVLGLKPNKGLEEITELAQSGKLFPVIDGPYSFDEIPQLLDYFAEGRHFGKVVISL